MDKRRFSAAWRLTLLLILVASLSACGFQLRGSLELPQRISPLSIDGLSEYDQLRDELESLLAAGSITLAEDAAGAAAILRVSDRASPRRVLSVDSRGKAAEYALFERARFSLLDGEGNPLVAEQRVEVERAYVNTQDQVLGKQYEEDILRREMRRDLATQILTRMRAALR